MNAVFGSSVYLGLKVRSEFIWHNTYTGRRRNFHSKPTSNHGQVHISKSNILDYRRHFSCLPQTFYKILINHLTQNVRYYFMVISSVISGFSPIPEIHI